VADLLAQIGERNRQQAGVLISVCRTAGSVPREVGARLWLDQAGSLGTIGGGQLEYRALAIAEQLLVAPSSAPQLERFPLSARVGQCCGGTVWLAFEHVVRGQLPSGPRTVGFADGTNWQDTWATKLPVVYLFGAGHVGEALAKILQDLPLNLHWFDSRDNTPAQQLDDPCKAVKQAPANAYFLVLTHSHAEDLDLIEAILNRADAQWIGLIGSATKRAQFNDKLAAKGLAMSAVNCPIGLAISPSKHPTAIAVAVAAQLLAKF
jgi:xanthine dehydrogenase accessory factor